MDPSPMVKLAQQDPFVATIQGEGDYVGEPAVFIRLFGCTTMCSWCDTKYAWQEGHGYFELMPDDIVKTVNRDFPNIRHIVLTGGNPYVQGEKMPRMAFMLSQPSHPNSRLRRHVSIETEGSIYYDKLSHSVSSITLSPKLWCWPDKVIAMFYAHHYQKITTKIVVGSKDDVSEAIDKLLEIHTLYSVGDTGGMNYILQPKAVVPSEFSTQESTAVYIEQVSMQVVDWVLDYISMLDKPLPFRLRVIPQVHRLLGLP